MAKIIGRKSTIKQFDKILKSDQAQFVTLFGRRRVGKTFIIREYLNKHFVFDFTGSHNAPTKVQLYNFHTEYLRYNVGQEINKRPNNWAEAFNNLANYLIFENQNDHKMVVFIDEMPWLDQPKSGFVSALEYFWNQHGSKMKNLILITCGSSASWILKNLIDATGGLYKRITHSIELLPFNLNETQQLLEAKNLKFTHYQVIQLYMAMGGIPFYLNMIEQGLSVNQVIDKLFFSKRGPLSNEFKPLYYSLFKKAENHIKIVEALANRPYGMSRKDLLRDTGIPNGGSFNRTIENLVDSGFIKEMNSYGKISREAKFKLIDLYSLFYLKFVKRNTNERLNTWESLAPSGSYRSWSGYAFENVCLLHIEQIHQALGIAGVFSKISTWNFKGNDEIGGAQIDLIIDRNDGIIQLCEAKFTISEYVLSKDYTTKLRQKRNAFTHVTKSKKSVVTTLLTTYPAIKNKHYLEEIHSEVTMDALFV